MSSQNKSKSLLNKSFLLQLWFVLFFILLIMSGLLVRMYSDIEDLEDLLSYTKPVGSDEVISNDPDRPIENIYVPIYSHIYSKGGKPILLEVTLSIRNTDSNNHMVINEVNYYDTKGDIIKAYIKVPIKIAPLATMEFLVEQKNIKGGSGANFIVAWASDSSVSTPIIEGVMIGTNDGQNVSFVSRGVKIGR